MNNHNGQSELALQYIMCHFNFLLATPCPQKKKIHVLTVRANTVAVGKQ